VVHPPLFLHLSRSSSDLSDLAFVLRLLFPLIVVDRSSSVELKDLLFVAKICRGEKTASSERACVAVGILFLLI
jgi:hypothetical protein